MFKGLSAEWKAKLGDRVLHDTEQKLGEFLDNEYACGPVFPARENIFRALNLCPPKSVKVVILGQDPYHGEGEAHGLAFSVQNGQKCPPSLRNIKKELCLDLGQKEREGGDLSDWARGGVLLLNTVLTVRKDHAFSHQNMGWEEFTRTVILSLAESTQPIVFMLWGKPAEKYASLLDAQKHLILTAPHPSPLSAHRGFFGCKHFSKANTWLKSKGRGGINW